MTIFDELRADYPATRQMAYLNVAARAPMSDTVVAKMTEFMASAQRNGGDKPAWLRELAQLRDRVGTLIGATGEDIAYVKNTSDGLGTIAASFPFVAGDNIVICPGLEHANNVYAWLNLRSKGVEVRIIEERDGRLPLDRVREATDARTRMISVTAVSFVTGARTDLAAVSQICRDVDAMLVVDAVQALGAVQFDVEALGIGAMAAATQKMLLGIYGSGVLYVAPQWRERLTPPMLSVQAVDLRGGIESSPAIIDYDLLPAARRYDVGNPNFAGLLAFSAALGHIEQVGPAAVEAHILSLASRLIEGLVDAGVEVITPREAGGFGPIVSFRMPEGSDLTVFERDGIELSHRRGLVRTSMHLFNDVSDIDRLLDTVRAEVGAHVAVSA